ncbi:hypothetical protein J5834_05150 [bacterium]|nr:hypothetical protein [bacterium]
MKHSFSVLTAICTVLTFFVSCGSAEQSSDSRPVRSSVNRPEWTNVAEKIEKSDTVFFIGDSSNAKSEEDALTLARQNAFFKVSNSFGVSVKSEFDSHEVEKNGEYSYAIGVKSSVTGKQIEVKNYHIKDKYTERNGRGYDAYVLVAIPKTELARIQIEVDGFGVWALNSELRESADKIRALFPVFNQKGIKLNQKIDFEDAEDVDKVFAASHKAFLLKIEIREAKAEEYNGEFYSVIQLNAELFNLLTKETINRWNIESKGAAYSADEARGIGISKAVDEIIEQITD